MDEDSTGFASRHKTSPHRPHTTTTRATTACVRVCCVCGRWLPTASASDGRADEWTWSSNAAHTGASTTTTCFDCVDLCKAQFSSDATTQHTQRNGRNASDVADAATAARNKRSERNKSTQQTQLSQRLKRKDTLRALRWMEASLNSTD